jgi:hypothetical protein
MQQQIWSTRLLEVRTHHPPPTAHGTPWSSYHTTCAHTQSPHRNAVVRTITHHRRDSDDDLDHRGSRQHARLCRSVAPRGSWTDWGGGRTSSLWMGGGGALSQPGSPWLPQHMEVDTGLSIYCCNSFIFHDHLSWLRRPVVPRHLNVDTPDGRGCCWVPYNPQ